MGYDCDYREVDITAVDTPIALTEQGADSPGNFDVPADASRITEIVIAVAPDWTADAAYGFSSGIHLEGSGVQVGEGYFPGPVGACAGAAASSQGMQISQVQRYLTNIPVKGGGKIKVTGCMMGEDMGSLHMLTQLVWDGPIAGRIKDCDYREENITAANTLVALQARHGSSEGDFKVADERIVEVFFGAGLKAVAGPLRFAPVLHLSGKGLARSGFYKFLGPSGGHQDDILAGSGAGGPGWIIPLARYIVDIPGNVGNTIRAQAQMIEDDAGTAYAIAGLAYG